MLQNLTGWHALIILAIVVLIFGAAKLPALARSVGQSMRILKSEVQTPAAEQTSSSPAQAATTYTADGTASTTVVDASGPVLRVAE